jgi:hypothetical protein
MIGKCSSALRRRSLRSSVPAKELDIAATSASKKIKDGIFPTVQL